MEAILQLLIDDGNPGRQQRDVLMDPKFRKVGISPSPHKLFGQINVVVFAQDMVEKHKEDPI